MINSTSDLNIAHSTDNSWRQFVGRQQVWLLGTLHIFNLLSFFYIHVSESETNFYFSGIKFLDFTSLVFIKFPLNDLDFALLSNRIATSHMWPFKLKLKLFKPISPLATRGLWLLYWTATIEHCHHHRQFYWTTHPSSLAIQNEIQVSVTSA